jgi:trehalose synthase-fused probable maltokinase
MVKSNIIIRETNWQNSFDDQAFLDLLENEYLPKYVNTCRWFAGKAKIQKSLKIKEAFPMANPQGISYLLIIYVVYEENSSENYFLPISFIKNTSENNVELIEKGVITSAIFENINGIIVDAIFDENFRTALFNNSANNIIIPQNDSDIIFTRGKGLLKEDTQKPLTNRVLLVEQSNSSLIFGEKYFMKLYRKLFDETNPEVELVAFLTEHSNFPYIPAFAGSIAWAQKGKPEVTLGMMQKMIDNQTDAWSVTSQILDSFIDSFLENEFLIKEIIFEKVELLASRSAEMHLALYAPDAQTSFACQPFDTDYRSFMVNRIKNLLDNRYNLIVDNYTKLEPEAQALAWIFMEAKELIDEFVEEFNNREIDSLRTRIHGDYHLGQVLATDSDYIIIDFEGEPESSITDRKIMHSPLKDVAGMLRSYHYAISAKFFNSNLTKNSDKQRIARASDRWFSLMQKTFLEKYFSTFGNPHPLFKNNNENNFLLLIYLLEKAVYELGYEVNYRPEWVKIPLKGIVDVVREIEKLKQ